jgi:hypothetical protein
MATNPYFGQSVRSEQGLYEDIIIESLKIYGQDIYYLPRDIVNEDKFFGEDVPSRFNSSYKIEMYVENMDGFDGEGDLFTKFGVEIRDQATLIVSRRRWSQTIQRHDNEITIARPAEGDLIYIPFSKKLFQISHVEHESPFYQLQNLPTFKLRCELFEYGEEDFDTNIETIDSIQEDYGYAYNMIMNTIKTPATATASIADGILTGITITAGGAGYSTPPNITLSTGSGVLTAVLDGTGAIGSITITDAGAAYVNPPTITIAPPSAADIGYTVGKMADQTLADGTILSGEVASFNSDTNALKLVSLGSSDGKFHLPAVGRVFVDRTLTSGLTVSSLVEDIQGSANEQNEYFDTLTDFLDFSESNPFGEPE